MYGLRIRVNGLEINSTFTKTPLPEVTSPPVGLFIGCDILLSKCTCISVDDGYFAQNIEKYTITTANFAKGL